MMRRNWPVWATMFTLVAACATQWEVDRYEAPEANLAARSTFAWKAGDFGTPTELEPEVAAAVGTQLRAVVTEELARKGYVQVAETANPQFVMSYQVAGTRRVVERDAERIGAPSPNTVLSPSEMQPPPASAVGREMTVREGTLVVFADDPATGKLIWRGIVNAVSRLGSNEQSIRELTEVAREIARQFPARGTGP